MPLKPKTPWYKQKKILSIIGVIAVIVIIFGVYFASHYDSVTGFSSGNEANSTSQNQDSESSTEDSSSTSTSTKEDTKTLHVTLNDGTKVTGTDETTYKPDFSDSSWHGNELHVTLVNVFTTNPYDYSDDDDGDYTAHGLVYVEMNYTPTEDIETLVNEVTISTDTGVESNVDYLDSVIPDSIDSGVTKNFELIFPISDISSSDDFSTLRLKFPMSTDDDSADMHDYDLSIDLTK